jgi:hypothetical protein
LGVSYRELKIAPDNAVPARVREPLAAIRESELAPYPVFGERLSDNGLLCQPEAGFQANLDISFGLRYEGVKLTASMQGQKQSLVLQPYPVGRETLPIDPGVEGFS